MKKKSTVGVYIQVEDVIRLQHKASGFHFLPRQPLQSLLAGRQASRLRGRGLDFEELRLYQKGDDTRTIDWKVSNRTRKAYVRVYGEEKEREVMFVLDQRLSMFFGSKKSFKSVTAVEALALGAWKVLDTGDRVGAILFNDSESREFKAQRSRKSTMAILNEAVKLNQQLAVDKDISESPGMLNSSLEKLLHKARHNNLIIVISDFHGMDEKTYHHVRALRQHNDVVLVLIYDELAKEFPENHFPIRVSDGVDQVELDLSQAKLREAIPDLLQGRLKSLSDALGKFDVPVLPLNTDEDVAEQLRKKLGGQQLKRAHKPNVMKGSRS
ncbi:DUF58 domain-containing protein [Lentisphaera marina]|uniref:DUF58 domain-containing protein n=1 Tax=Lentisphaera marina TaxID=1111041 RepID=UPI002366D23F|nr:DUF58 domain-containing protein [Lentisphaera marina]MDD7983795.1 DUF58 domain-containing protein [Lentisphaera marina]